MRTLNNTKSNGRREARAAIADGMFANELRLLAALWLTREASAASRHFAAGFADEVYRRTCWNDFCDNWAHEGDWHSDGTGHGWTQARGTAYCPAEHGYMPRGHACIDDATDE